MSDQICLKWNSFLNNIATSFQSLWEEEGFVDVTLASDGQCLTAHKVILAASSPFFKKVFQTNPCQHPVIILQDVHFRELEALLIFVYKGEVNIEQQNLPALLKAAETLKIRGLSGGDMFAKKLYKRFVDLDNAELNDIPTAKDEAPKKKRKVAKKQNNSILAKALDPQATVSENSNDANSANVEQNFKEPDPASDAVLLRLEMKTEPLEIHTEDFQKHSPGHKDALERLDIGQVDPIQGSGNSPAEDISGLSGLSGISGITDEKPVILYAYQQLPYADLLPKPDVIATWATSKPMDHLACDLMKILFTTEERILCNVNGKMGKQQFDRNRIHLIREVLVHFSGIASDSIEWEEAWKNCVTKIDTSNRGLKRSIRPIETKIKNDAKGEPEFATSTRLCLLLVLPTHAAWRRHVISAHNLSSSDAHNGLLILEEAHMVLQIAHPTRLDTLVNIIKQSSQHNTEVKSAQAEKEDD